MADGPLQVTVDDCTAPQARALGDWLRLLRLPHWAKNGIVFPAVLLAGRAAEPAAWQQAAWVFAAFCLASSSVYAVNDLLDCQADRLHPSKCRRPVAAGRCGVGTAVWTAVLLALAALGLAVRAAAPAAICVLAYLALNLAYSLRLKHVPIADGGCIAAGFVLRLVASLGVPGPDLRQWLLLASVFLLCLCVALAKRTADLRLLMGGASGVPSGLGLDGYTPGSLRLLLPAVAAATVLVYGLFAWVAGSGTVLPMLTLLPVLFSLFRLARLSTAGVYVEQIDLVRSDGRLLASALAWLALWGWISIPG